MLYIVDIHEDKRSKIKICDKNDSTTNTYTTYKSFLLGLPWLNCLIMYCRQNKT